MSDKDKKLSPEKLQQLKQLQQLMMMQKANGTAATPGAAGRPPAPKKFSAKGLFIGMLNGMQRGVKFVDLFIDFIIKPDSDKTNDVIKRARAPILFGTFVLIFFVLVGVTWSALAPLDSATVAVGSVISNSNKKLINHQEGGIVKKIYVEVGDLVEKDEVLIKFDDTRIRSQYETTLNQYRSYAAAEARLLAEVSQDTTITYPEFLLNDNNLPDVAKIIDTQNNLFRSKKLFSIG
ncbi:MAG: hypothetical protein P8P83_01380 [Rickettsiaceae bacterium]|nr:hypothetical protein [Rickettsiaceae bacterium]